MDFYKFYIKRSTKKKSLIVAVLILVVLGLYYLFGDFTKAEAIRYYKEDLEKYFAVKYAPMPVIYGPLNDTLLVHDVKIDSEYSETTDILTQNYGPYVLNGFESDRRTSVRSTNSKRGYGLFADVDIAHNVVIGEYTGVITSIDYDTDYTWIYPSKVINNGQTLELGLDAKYTGNLMRFANHDNDPNCDNYFILVNNLWRKIYVSNRRIYKDEEITVDYGQEYWDTRK